MYTVLVTGSRDWHDSQCVIQYLQQCETPGHMRLVHGGCASGADAIAHAYAKAHNWEIVLCPANWQQYGRRAGPRRNAEMVKRYGPETTHFLVFCLNQSPGTENTLQHIRNLKSRLRGSRVVICRG